MKKILLTLLLILSTSLYPTTKAYAQQVEDDTELMYEEYKKGSYDNTIVLGLKMLKKDPYDIYALSYVAGSYMSVGEYSQALYYSAKINRMSKGFLFNKALINVTIGYDEAAMKLLNEALQFDEDYAMALNGRGGIYCEHFRREEAIADLEKAIELFEANESDPYKIYLPYYNMAVLHFNYEEYDEAAKWAEKAIIANESNLQSHFFLEQIKREKNSKHKYPKKLLKEIVEEYTGLISKNRYETSNWEMRADALNELGQKHAARRDYLQALDLYNQRLEDTPDSWRNLKDRASIYEDLGQKEEALKEYMKALELNPDDQTIVRSISKLREEKK